MVGDTVPLDVTGRWAGPRLSARIVRGNQEAGPCNQVLVSNGRPHSKHSQRMMHATELSGFSASGCEGSSPARGSVVSTERKTWFCVPQWGHVPKPRDMRRDLVARFSDGRFRGGRWRSKTSAAQAKAIRSTGNLRAKSEDRLIASVSRERRDERKSLQRSDATMNAFCPEHRADAACNATAPSCRRAQEPHGVATSDRFRGAQHARSTATRLFQRGCRLFPNET